MYGNVSGQRCLVFQNSCQGLASPERQRPAPLPVTLRPPWHPPSDACSRRDLDSLAGAWVQQGPLLFFFIFFHPVSSSLHLKSCSAIKLKKCSKDLCQNVCPSQWHMPNCQLTGGHTTWGTVNFPQQMEVCWSRRRPTTGLLEQMLCRQSLDLCFPHPPLAPSSLTAFVDVSRALQHDRYPNLKFLYYPSCLSNHLQPFRS